MKNTPIKHKESDSRGMFYMKGEQGVFAELTYVINSNSLITIDHTEVKLELEGQGIATELLKACVQYARNRNLKIEPLCPFAEVMFERYEEFRDVRA
ncbi:GNAT family N-acetyltransferase [Zunongwangia sp.]|uniref:GNAT family N-acetyltransferase n=1 Tax=Zunongwangia sp. TaxID=1965325 RepID=UPI003AA7E90A